MNKDPNYCEICDQEMESEEYYFCDICPDCRDMKKLIWKLYNENRISEEVALELLDKYYE